MKWQIATIVLAVLLVVGGAFFGIKIVNITSELNRLEADYSQLQTSYNSLESIYWTLRDNYDSLEANYEALQEDFVELQSSYNQLEAENTNLRRLLEQYEEVPHDYYYAGAFAHHSNTYTELCHFLDYEFVSPRGYELDVFDCSESSSYLEWALENAGFDAWIAVGPTPWDPSSGRHAWLIVYTKEYRVAIEATALTGWDKFLSIFLFRTPGIVYTDDLLVPGWQNYYDGYDRLYKNIYEAVRYDGTTGQWDWWEVI
jgi:hypothetical protein